MIYTISPGNHNKTHRSEGLYFDGFRYPCELYAFLFDVEQSSRLGVSSCCYYNHYNVWVLESQDFF